MTPTIVVDASTRVTTDVGSVDFYPRRSVKTNVVHWFYGPRLFNGVEMAAPWCSADSRTPLLPCIPNVELSTKLTGGVPCPECSSRWSMT